MLKQHFSPKEAELQKYRLSFVKVFFALYLRFHKQGLCERSFLIETSRANKSPVENSVSVSAKKLPNFQHDPKQPIFVKFNIPIEPFPTFVIYYANHSGSYEILR